MINLLIRLLNLPIAIQRFIAIMILLIVAASFVTLGQIGFSILKNQNQDIVDARLLLGRLAQISSLASNALDEPLDNQDLSSVLSGSDKDVVQAELQNHLKNVMQQSNVTLLSAGGVKLIQKEGVEFVGLRANVQGSLPAIHRAIVELETGQLHLSIREITIRPTGGSNQRGAPQSEIVLTAQFTFYGALNPVSNVLEKGDS